MTEWKEYTLGELITIKYGKDHKQLSDGVYPVYGSGGIMRYADKYLYDKESILIPRKGSLNNIFYEDKAFWTVDTMFWSEIDATKVNPKFLYYQLTLVDFENLNVGSAVPSLTIPIINDVDVVLPPLDEQRRIAAILSSLDNKIDLLHRENATLEQMAETLFRQWFVVEAKEEWEEGKLGDILSVKGGTTPSTKEPNFWDGDIAWTSPRDVTTLNGLYLFETEKKITQKGLEQISSGLLPAGTLLMSSRAPVGVLAFAEIPLAINQGYIAILDDKGYPKEFIYLWLKANMDLVHSYSNGSTFMEISKSAFKSLDIVIPTKAEVVGFVLSVKPFFEKIKLNEKQIRLIIRQRDSLLPKLMSNEINL